MSLWIQCYIGFSGSRLSHFTNRLFQYQCNYGVKCCGWVQLQLYWRNTILVHINLHSSYWTDVVYFQFLRFRTHAVSNGEWYGDGLKKWEFFLYILRPYECTRTGFEDMLVYVCHPCVFTDYLTNEQFGSHFLKKNFGIFTQWTLLSLGMIGLAVWSWDPLPFSYILTHRFMDLYSHHWYGQDEFQ